MNDPKIIAAWAGVFLIIAGVALIAAHMIVAEINNKRRVQAERATTPIRIGQIHLETKEVGIVVALLGVVLMLAVIGVSFWGK